jgi:hypothetical protein
MLLIGSNWINISLTIALLLSFSYFHNGAYYCVRNILNPELYKEKYKAESTTSSATIELSYKQRFTLFIVGISILIGSIIVYLLI